MIHRPDQYEQVMPRVLDYRAEPQRKWSQTMLEAPSQIVDACGGIDSFLFYLSLCFLCFGFFGMIPFLTIWWILIDRWSKRSRWF